MSNEPLTGKDKLIAEMQSELNTLHTFVSDVTQVLTEFNSGSWELQQYRGNMADTALEKIQELVTALNIPKAT